jgi:hypothetical protein
MAHKATLAEEQLLSGEAVLAPEVLIDQLPLITVKAVYLGGHPLKTVRLKGHIAKESIKDPDNPDAEPYEIARQVNEGYQTYDFADVDNRGRKRQDRRTADGKRWEPVSHLAHIAALYRMRDADKMPMFKISATKEALGVVQRYLEATKKMQNPDSGAAVLQDMGM